MKNKVLNIILLIIWLAVIFMFSSDNYNETMNKSSKLSFITNIICKNDDCKTTATLIIRKVAHFTEYFVLAVLILNVIKDYKAINYKLLLLTFIICLLYAASDEWHQTFVDGRVGTYKDVIVDSLGSLTYLIIYKIFHKNKD